MDTPATTAPEPATRWARARQAIRQQARELVTNPTPLAVAVAVAGVLKYVW